MSPARLRDTLAAFLLLIHGKLVGPDGLIFMHAALDVPARKISAISTRKSSRTKAADWRALPVPVIDHA
jgi:hypothetical protein